MSSSGIDNRGLRITRRRLLGLSLGAVGAGLGIAFGINRTRNDEDASMRGTEPIQGGRVASAGRLTARPRQANKTAQAGLQQLKLEDKRDGFIYVPAGYRADRPAPLILMLHGAGGNARRSVPLLQHLADSEGIILLVPDSREQTWDIIGGGYGPDVAYIDRALEQTFSRYNIDSTRLAIGGFSDGASYALSLGTTNGDLFTHVIAFSPGFNAPARQQGFPALYISHGIKDGVLPIDVCSRKIVPRLKQAGYQVLYKEFDGAHTVPPEIAREAVEWFLKAAPAHTRKA